MSTTENKAQVRRFFDEVWNQGREAAIAELVPEDAIAHGMAHEAAADLRGPAAFMPFYQVFRTAFPDIHITLDDLIAEDDKVVARCTVRATHQGDSLGVPATGKSVVFSGVAIARMRDGKIVESWNTFDLLGLMQQIGAFGPAANNDNALAANTVAPTSASPGSPIPAITTEVDDLRQGTR